MYVVSINGVWHGRHRVYGDEEAAKHEARESAAEGNDAQVYKLVETHYYKARPDAGQ